MLIRFVLAGLLPALLFPAEQGQLDASPSLFSVLAAINAAGYDADIDSPANDPLRELVRKELASKHIPSLPELKKFFEEHRQRDWTAELSQYVSFALSVDGPPDFKYRFLINQLPPDVFPLQGLEKLLARFHREANLDELWRKAQPFFERAIARYHEPVLRAVLEANAYLRNPTSGSLGRRFQVYIDLLGAPNQIHVRSYADDYFVVLTPSPEPQISDVRHAYLHYLLDPITLRHAEELNKKKALIDYALGAPFLEEMYKKDFHLLATECLVKAVESRLAPPSKRQGIVDQALKEGYILTPFFAEALPAYEKQEQALRFYFPEMLKTLDLAREEQRLEKVQFAQERPVRKAKVVPAERVIEQSPAQKLLEEAEELYSKRDLEKARQAYLKLLAETQDKPVQARSYYGLARIAALQKDPELAEKLFQKTLELAPDAHTGAWTHVYLGRLAEAAGQREEAVRHYQAALAVEGAPAGARKAAEQGLAQSTTNQRTPD